MNINNLNKSKIEFSDIENVFSLDFFSMSKENNLVYNAQATSIKLLKDTELLIACNENKISFDFYKKVKYLQFITFSLLVDTIFEINENNIKFIAGDTDYVLDFGQTKFSLDSSNAIIVVLSESSHNIQIIKAADYQSIIKSQNFEAFTISNPFLIDETSKMPEFSIGIFDDASLVLPRPIRQGNPVISTVPAVINDNSTADEIDYYNTGLGPISKTIHFKIICNQILESALTAGDLSTNLQLKVYLPNGLDTVKTATYENMYFVSKDTTNNVSIYSASYIFYKQGSHNNIDYVDGFMYFDVHCPLTVQKSLPFQFDFSI
jgi:hypothetical protein